MFLGVRLPGLFGVISRVDGMATSGVSMMGGFLVLSAFMILSRLSVVARRMGMMFGGFPMVFRCLLGHNIHPLKKKSPAGSRAGVLTAG
jgi:hypothetical protein